MDLHTIDDLKKFLLEKQILLVQLENLQGECPNGYIAHIQLYGVDGEREVWIDFNEYSLRIFQVGDWCLLADLTLDWINYMSKTYPEYCDKFEKHCKKQIQVLRCKAGIEAAPLESEIKKLYDEVKTIDSEVEKEILQINKLRKIVKRNFTENFDKFRKSVV